jgi:Zn-dependent protease/predicted transcriptional regulator
MPTGPGWKIGRILGIPIYLHSSWVFIFVLITFWLKESFAKLHSAWPVEQQWGVGLGASLLFFGSVLFHELAHSAVAKHYKIRVVSITLFLFGGLARIGRDPYKASQEFNIAVAGPLASFFLCGFFFGVAQVFPGAEILSTVSLALGWINLQLAVFNLVPGFPLDGGRMFRALIWHFTKNFAKATRIAGGSGRFLAYGLMLYGVVQAVRGDWISGAWKLLIGWFLLEAARESVAQVDIQETLAGLRATDVMSHEVPTIPRDISLEEYGAEVLRTGRRCHIVITDDRLVGMMNVHTLNSVPREEWAHNSVQAAMIPREKILWATPDEPLLPLLQRLLAADINQMPVVSGSEENGAHIVGMVTRDSILRVMQTRSEIGTLSYGK